jgi:hypothetical protein
MQKGLRFDTSQNSRIFELAPKFTEKLVHGEDPSLAYRVMAAHGSFCILNAIDVGRFSLMAPKYGIAMRARRK